jgi:hypothetical protein
MPWRGGSLISAILSWTPTHFALIMDQGEARFRDRSPALSAIPCRREGRSSKRGSVPGGAGSGGWGWDGFRWEWSNSSERGNGVEPWPVSGIAALTPKAFRFPSPMSFLLSQWKRGCSHG